MDWYERSQIPPEPEESSVILSEINLADLKFKMPLNTRDFYMEVMVNVGKFDELWKKDPDFYVSPGGIGQIHNRYEGFGEFLKRGEEIEMPIASVTSFGTVQFTNGRHRFAFLRDLGLREIPICMDKESVKFARQSGVLA